jgi:hypothetical protein
MLVRENGGSEPTSSPTHFFGNETVPWKDPVIHKELLLKELEVLKLPQM